jgi:LPXTG-site transpeptidase (sortase) family protein
MSRLIPVLSKGMLIAGGLMILAGLGWGIWLGVNAPPPPVITSAGAVVLAVTAAVEPSVVPPTPTPTPPTATTAPPRPSQPPAATGPAAALLPEWQAPRLPSDPTPTNLLPTLLLPTPSLTPSPARPAQAQKPPTRIVAPAIGLDAPIVPMGWEMVDRDGTMVSEWVVPQKAAGWHMNSALPGHGDNVVLSGHHNIEGKVFRYVVDLEPGDEITLYVDDIPYVYVVTEKYILKEAGMPLQVRQKNAQWIMPTGEERLTLVTCWPYEWPGNSHRVIVVARPCG